MTKVKDVTPSAAHAMTKKGALLVDVREQGEVAGKSFDIPDIMLVPLSKFEKCCSEIPYDRQVIIACNSGNRSMMAARMLMNQGYRRVANLQHGIIRWEMEGLPVKKKPKQNLMSLLLKKFSGRS
jgi:rhodanese-related sulfurtransferase